MSSLEVNCDAFTAEICLWDTAGMEKYSALAPIYYRDSSVAVLVFDVGEQSSFDHLPFWIRLYRCDGREANPVMLVGNKADLADRAVTEDSGRAFAARNNTTFLETSAKTGSNISRLTDDLIALIRHRRPPKPTIVTYAPQVKKVICC
jgi:small GTP-binding protein